MIQPSTNNLLFLQITAIDNELERMEVDSNGDSLRKSQQYMRSGRCFLQKRPQSELIRLSQRNENWREQNPLTRHIFPFVPVSNGPMVVFTGVFASISETDKPDTERHSLMDSAPEDKAQASGAGRLRRPEPKEVVPPGRQFHLGHLQIIESKIVCQKI